MNLRGFIDTFELKNGQTINCV